MKVEVQDTSTIERTLRIELDAAIIDRELTQAYQRLSRTVKLPGFRPGKIPRRILEQHYRAEVEDEVVRRVQMRGFLEAAKEKNLVALGEPTFEGPKLVLAQPYAFTAVVEVKPIIEPQGYEGLKLAAIPTRVSDADLASRLDEVRKARAKLKDVDGRTTIEVGDVVTADIEVTVGGSPYPRLSGNSRELVASKGNLSDGFLERLVGRPLGLRTEFGSDVFASEEDEELKAKNSTLVVTPTVIRTREIPPLDAAFAKELGFDSVEAMTDGARAEILARTQGAARDAERDDVFRQLIEANPFEVPKALVHRVVSSMMTGAVDRLMRAGVDVRRLNIDWRDIERDMQPKAIIEAKGQLLLDAVATKLNLEVADADFEGRLAEMAKEMKQPLAKVRSEWSGQAGARLRAGMRSEQAFQHILDHAKRS